MTGYITDNLISVRKWGNEQTERHTRNIKFFLENAKKDSSSRTRYHNFSYKVRQ